MANKMQTLSLYFGPHSDKFREFLNWYLYRAGSSWNPEQVKEKGNGGFEITGTPSELYNLGYDWALYQFPPKG